MRWLHQWLRKPIRSSLGVSLIKAMCLDDTGWSKTPGTHLQLWSCLYPYSSHMNQSWEFDYLGDTWCLGETYVRCNVYLVRNAYATGMCLDDWMNSSGQSPAVIYTCNRYDPAQQIEVENLGSLVDNTPFNELSHYRFSNCLDNSNDRSQVVSSGVTRFELVGGGRRLAPGWFVGSPPLCLWLSGVACVRCRPSAMDGRRKWGAHGWGR